MADIPCIGAVVFDDQGRLLLVQRANPPAQGLWSLPGGRQEPGETAEQGVVREVREETGLTVRVEQEVGTVVRQAPSGDDYVIRDFVCVVRGMTPWWPRTMQPTHAFSPFRNLPTCRRVRV